MNINKAVILLSGGIDSSTLLYMMHNQEYDLYPITILYGQKHSKEIAFAIKIAETLKLGARHKIIDLGDLRVLLRSSLTNFSDEVPEGHYAAENMKSTVVPNRNLIMLSIAAGYAQSIGAKTVAYAAHSGDHAIYPDCRPEFVKAAKIAIREGTGDKVDLHVPFLFKDKKQIVEKGLELSVPYNLTWSCYKGKQRACGKCGSCIERLEAFQLNNATDPIEYKKTDNLCDYCSRQGDFPYCKSNNVKFGEGLGNDNIIQCDSYHDNYREVKE